MVKQLEGQKKVDALNTLATRFQTISPEEALQTLKESTQLAQQIGYHLGEVDALLVEATVFSLSRQYVRADQRIKEALQKLQSTPNKERLARTYLFQSSHQGRQSSFDLSIESALSGLTLAREIENRDLEASFLMNIGRDYEIMGELSDAGEYLLQAQQVYIETNDQYRLGQVNINLGVLEYKKHNLGLSIEYNQKALNIFRELGDKAHIALSLQNLGFAYWKLEDHPKALNYYDISEDIREELGDVRGQAALALNKAKVYHSMGLFKEVVQSAHKALELANQIQHKRLSRDVHFFLHQYYSDHSDFQLALKHHKLFITLNDSLTLEANQKKIAEIRAQFEFEELANENQLQLQQNQIQSLQIRQRNYIISGLFLLILLAIRLFILQRKKFRIKFQLGQKDKLLAEKEAELANSQLLAEQRQSQNFRDQLIVTQEVLQITKDKLVSNRETYSLGDQQVSDFIDKLNHSLGERDWAKFKLHFESIYPQFFEKLNQQTRHLGKNDDRLAAMIRIKLTNKEIATALSITPESVVRAKNRLKSKMGFDTYQDLENLILSF